MTTILGYLFDKIKEKGYELLKDFFFPKKTYIGRLHKIIINTIQEFEKKYTIRENRNESFPFYHSKILYEKLIIVKQKWFAKKLAWAGVGAKSCKRVCEAIRPWKRAYKELCSIYSQSKYDWL